jgi:hypothetical protein
VDAPQNDRMHKHFYTLFLVILLLGCSGVLLLSALSGDSPHLITSDGKAYYAWARSVLLDRDMDFSNDYAMLYPPDPLPPEAGRVTPRGLVVNKYPVGMGILCTPGLLLGHLVANIHPLISADGISGPYQFAVAYTLLLLAGAGLYFLFHAMRNLGASSTWAALTSIAAFVCTNLIHYMGKEPAMPHAAGMALISLLIWDITRFKTSGTGSAGRSFAWGALLGLLVLVRNSNVFVLPFIGGLLLHQGGLRLRCVLPLGIGMMVVGMWQPISLYALWGEFRLTTYPDEKLSGDLGGLVRTLFSARHGLFIYHPWYLVLSTMTWGGLLTARLRGLTVSAQISFMLLAVMNGSWASWWFGDSFGNRAFIEALPPLSIVTALVLTSMGNTAGKVWSAVAMIGVLAVVNAWLWVGYLLQRYPHDGTHTVSEAYGWPRMDR